MQKNQEPQEPQEATLNFRVPESMHDWLRKHSYDTKVSIAEICRLAISDYQKKHEKSKK